MSEPDACGALAALLQLMRDLRDPDHGCRWDRAQSFSTIAPHTIEEAYEVADAIARNDLEALRDELGDLLFQVVFHAQLAAEQGRFDFAAVARGITDKLVRRHPHVFAGRSVANEELSMQWEQHKSGERAARGEQGTLAGVAQALPALARAYKLSKRAAAIGFEWPDRAAVHDKVQEELGEVEAAMAKQDEAAVAEEVGDLLTAVVNLARHCRVEPEAALRASNRKFERRFAAMEKAAAGRRRPLAGLSAAEWDELWNLAKQAESG